MLDAEKQALARVVAESLIVQGSVVLKMERNGQISNDQAVIILGDMYKREHVSEQIAAAYTGEIPELTGSIATLSAKLPDNIID